MEETNQLKKVMEANMRWERMKHLNQLCNVMHANAFNKVGANDKQVARELVKTIKLMAQSLESTFLIKQLEAKHLINHNVYAIFTVVHADMFETDEMKIKWMKMLSDYYEWCKQ